ncbi:hypothetical protein [Sivoneniella epilithica]
MDCKTTVVHRPVCPHPILSEAIAFLHFIHYYDGLFTKYAWAKN